MPIPTNYPGTIINEIDNSAQLVQSYGSYAAVMGRAMKGIVNSKVLVNTPQDLIAQFGAPVVSGSYPLVTAIDYGIYAGLEALKETGNLWYVRLTDGTETYAGVQTSGTYVAISAAPTSSYNFSAAGYNNGNTPNDISDLTSQIPTSGSLRFNSIGPGVYGNSIAVSVEAPTVSSDWYSMYDDVITLASKPKSMKIFRINVYVKDPSAAWSDVSATVSPVETFYASTDFTMTDASGRSLFVEDVVNGNSDYVFVKSAYTNGTIPENVTPSAPKLIFSGGSNASTISTINATAAWGNFFSNKERNPIDIAILIPRTKDAQTDTGEITTVDGLISSRYDFITPVQVGALSDTSDNGIITANSNIQQYITSNPSYFAKYYGWTLVYDSYNSSRVYLPNCIFAAAVMLRVDRISKPWEAPAGIERGIISSGKQNKDVSPVLGAKLYDKNINTIKYVNNVGNAIWGQKTAQLKNTARNRINVRRALLYIEKNVEDILNSFLFRGNTVKERERVTSMVNAFMQGVLAGSGVQSYKIVCDNSNNDSSSNTLVVDLYIQPTYTIEFIKLNTVISASSVSTAEK